MGRFKLKHDRAMRAAAKKVARRDVKDMFPDFLPGSTWLAVLGISGNEMDELHGANFETAILRRIDQGQPFVIYEEGVVLTDPTTIPVIIGLCSAQTITHIYKLFKIDSKVCPLVVSRSLRTGGGYMTVGHTTEDQIEVALDKVLELAAAGKN